MTAKRIKKGIKTKRRKFLSGLWRWVVDVDLLKLTKSFLIMNQLQQ